MKKMLFWAAALVCCTVMAEIAASYDFDGKTGNAKAAGKFRYVDGFRNKAIALSDGTVRIPCPANLTPEEGSISFWVKPMNWDSSVTEFLFLLQNNNQEKNGRIIVYIFFYQIHIRSVLIHRNVNHLNSKVFGNLKMSVISGHRT